jgi:hypothetical protein
MEKINDNMTTREHAFEWLEKNKYILTSSIKFTPQQIRDFFAAYNLVTGEAKPVVGCGRCILNMKHRLITELKKVEQAQPQATGILQIEKYPVYKTAKGNFTLVEQGSPIAFVWATDLTSAKAKVKELKKES